jgi:putative heme-binding domain-containing protein
MPALRFVQRAALIALDQIDGGGLTAMDVLPHLNSADPVLKQTASWIVSHHSDWGKDLSEFFRQRLAQSNLSTTELGELLQQLGDFTRNEAIQELIAQVCGDSATPLETRQLLLRVMAQAPLREIPAAWRPTLHQCLAQTQEVVLRSAVAVIRALPLGKTNATEFAEPLLRLARDPRAPTAVKLEALAALPSGPMSLDVETFDFLFGYLDSAKPPLDRTTAATVLGRMKLDDAQLMKLSDAVAFVGPMELSKLIGAFENKTNETVGLKFVSVLKQAKGVRGARPDLLKPIFAKFGSAVQAQGEDVIHDLNADLAQQQTRITQLVNGLPRGDRDQGRRVFESQKTVCSTCHQVGYLGGRVGPDLTRIGSVRTERDLMEAVIYPSASFVRSYEPMTIRTKDGEEYSGVLRQEGADSIVIISGANASQRFAMSDVAEMRPGTLSIMPEGIDQQLNQQELADLVAFLKSLK